MKRNNVNATDDRCCNNLPGGEPLCHPLDDMFRVCGDEDYRLIRAPAPCSQVARKITLIVVTRSSSDLPAQRGVQPVDLFVCPRDRGCRLLGWKLGSILHLLTRMQSQCLTQHRETRCLCRRRPCIRLDNDDKLVSYLGAGSIEQRSDRDRWHGGSKRRSMFLHWQAIRPDNRVRGDARARTVRLKKA